MKAFLQCSLKPATVTTYTHHWNKFVQFLSAFQIEATMPIDSSTLAMFVAHLHNNGLKYSTIRTYLSAVSFLHKLKEIPDNTNSLLVTKTLQGITNNVPSHSMPLLPITRSNLHLLVRTIPLAVRSPYLQCMLKALFLLVFHACMRAGEAVVSSEDYHTLNISHVQEVVHNDKQAFKLTFPSYKHCNESTTTLLLPGLEPQVCPVLALRTYLQCRGNHQGPLFLNENKLPVTRSAFSSHLKSCLRIAGLPPHRYNTHSFRIGRATQLAEDNAPQSVIQSVGRWHSSAYQKYIRPTSSQLPS